jgi:hypothetical protein
MPVEQEPKKDFPEWAKKELELIRKSQENNEEPVQISDDLANRMLMPIGI